MLTRDGFLRLLLLAAIVCLCASQVMLFYQEVPTYTPRNLAIAGFVSLFLFVLLRRWNPRVIDDYGSAAWASVRHARDWMGENTRDVNVGATVELGTLVEDQKIRAAWTTDKHVLVVASAGSGKGTDVIIPNLLSHEGSVFALDPKGENARATARHRASLGTVHCLDPWGLTGRPKSRFNPLARLCLPENADDVATSAAALAAALVVPDKSGNQYFTNSARQLIEGLIGFVVTEPNLRPLADLRMVRELLTRDLADTLKAMVAMKEGPDAIRSNGGRMLSLDSRESGGIVSSAITETAFLDDPRLQDCLSTVPEEPEKQIDFSAWRDGTMSVYVCLPPLLFAAFNRWLRLLVTSALDEMMRLHRPPQKPVMFMLDELAALDHLQPVADAVGLARGYGVQIWSIFQDLGQMKDIYRERSTSFIGNAGVRLFFGTQDHDTAETVSKMLGNKTWERRIQRGGMEDLHHGGRPLLMPDEVMRLPQNEMICFLPAKAPLRLRRTPYYLNGRFAGQWDDPR